MTTTNNTERLDLQQNAGSQNEQVSCSTLHSAPLSTTAYALEYRTAGLSVMPVDSANKKAVYKWKSYQSTLPTEDEIRSWWSTQKYSIATICGAVSGNLEVIDFDEKYNLEDEQLLDRWEKEVETLSPGLVSRLVKQTTMTKGYHIIYRCSAVEGNQSLARRPITAVELEKDPDATSMVLIETRGEGGYFLNYPSTGYALIAGDLRSIPEITPDEREILFSCARMLNSYVDQKSAVGHALAKVNGNRPGDEYNTSGDHRELLEKHGWKCISDCVENELWQRPGKKHGVSASYHKEMKVLYIFSSNASPFEAGRAYTHFGIFALLETNGDYSEAAKKLAALGYGETRAIAKGDTRHLIESVEAFIQTHCKLRRNIVTGRVEIQGWNQTEYSILGDYEINSLHGLLLKANLSIGYDMLCRHLNSDFVVSYDPFISYFDSLPAWDGVTDNIEKLAASVTLVDPNEKANFRNDMERWLIGYVATAIQVDAVNQAAIIFTGEQGIGKGRWLNRLIPQSLLKHLYVGTIYPENKDALIYLAECMLINLDEFEDIGKSNIGALKTLMTMPSITVRRPYGRFPETMVRRASFVGSINKKEFLNDDTGSRRFLTYEVVSFDFASMPDIDLVMAQAYKLYQDGNKWWFTESEIAAVNTRNMKFAQMSYEEELLLDTIYKGTTYWYTSTQIAEKIKEHHLDFRVDRNSVRNIGIALNKNGYDSKPTNKGRRYNVELRPLKTGE